MIVLNHTAHAATWLKGKNTMQLFIKCGTRYKPAPISIITEVASEYLVNDPTGQAFTDPKQSHDFFRLRIGRMEREVFGVLFLNSKHKVIDFKIMFEGTIDQAHVYPREIVKRALAINCAAVIFGHNHPSGDSTPSKQDVLITRMLKYALNTVDVRVLDHIVVGSHETTSFAEKGLL